jgi:hypothetical protein
VLVEDSLKYLERPSAILAQRHGIAWGRALPAQERRPIIVEIAKVSRDVDRARFDLLQAGVLKQPGKRGRLANREAAAFVELQDGRIQQTMPLGSKVRMIRNSSPGFFEGSGSNPIL